ncbi:MAG TPA: hemerythrin domain-containing protein [Nevskiaceae bacterium]|nr:hemerythrin domain-containing protein [Nevskiaceae bacterium]
MHDDALALLHDDHERVKQLFAQFDQSRERRNEIVEQACSALSAHTQLEESLFYPAAQEHIRRGNLVEEARVEHDSVKQLISKLQSGLLDDAARDATFRVMARMVAQHIAQEEQELFPEVRASDLDLAALGEKMRSQHQDLQEHPVLTTGQHSTARASHEPAS